MANEYTAIPKEKFAFANTGDKIRDQKFEDKPIGYFRDAWNRFCKNKASIIAAIIIICIILIFNWKVKPYCHYIIKCIFIY